MNVNKSGPTPLYLQVKKQLLQKIECGEYSAHERLPSEREISDQLGISRQTVRRALVELARVGRIYTSIGKGTFVAEPRIGQDLPLLTSFTEDMQNLGMQPSSIVLEAHLMPAPADVAERLQMTTGADTVLLRRLRLANKQPVQLVTEYLPHSLCPDLLSHDFQTASLYETLRHRYGLKLAKARQVIETDLAGKEEARLLQVAVLSPVLRLERTTFLENNTPIGFSKAVYRGDRFTFKVTLFGQS
jgi:GntR family transcriptional regulator